MSELTIADRIEKATTQVPLLNAEQKEALHLIDTVPVSINRGRAVMELVGVVAGIKSAADLEREDFDIELIDALGLAYDLYSDKYFTVSWDKKLSQELSSLFLQRQPKDIKESTERRIGKLLGYPETATEYYIRRMKTINTPNKLPSVKPRSLKGTVTDLFHMFVLSPDHTQQEIDTYVKPLEAAVKALTPNAYGLLVEEVEYHAHRSQMRQEIGRYASFLIEMPQYEEEPDPDVLYVD
ncbi:MAG: hypothetical protein JWO54_657 [Candidatus Saccharibacteria bacterium]|nr:hypothetical protein [Candidatus Saccharibacteria bacterium]